MKKLSTTFHLWSASLCICLTAACSDDLGADGDDALAIEGEYVENFGAGTIAHSITAEDWTQAYDSGESFVYTITDFSNEERWIVAQDDTEAYVRLEWTSFEDRLFYCTAVFGAESEAAALEPAPADASDPVNGGCGNFPWSELVAE